MLTSPRSILVVPCTSLRIIESAWTLPPPEPTAPDRRPVLRARCGRSVGVAPLGQFEQEARGDVVDHGQLVAGSFFQDLGVEPLCCRELVASIKRSGSLMQRALQRIMQACLVCAPCVMCCEDKIEARFFTASPLVVRL